MKIVKGKRKCNFVGVLHGPHGHGKTHFGTTMPKPFFITCEESDDITADRTERIESWNDFIDALNWVKTQGYGSVIIDSIDGFEELLAKEIMHNDGARSIELACGGFGKGYKRMAETFHSLINTHLRPIAAMKNLLLICHTQKVKVDDMINGKSYFCHTLKLHKNAKGYGVSTVLSEWVPCIFYLSQQVFVKNQDGDNFSESTGERILYTTPKPYLEAKNRFYCSDEIPLGERDGWNKVKPYWDRFWSDGPTVESIIKRIRELLLSPVLDKKYIEEKAKELQGIEPKNENSKLFLKLGRDISTKIEVNTVVKNNTKEQKK